MSEPFVGQVQIWGCNFIPRGYAFCDGALIAVSQNTALFSLLGTTYGGNGRTNFALPNLQGRAPMGAGQGPGLSARALGKDVGHNEVSLIEQNLPTHTHSPIKVAQDQSETNEPSAATIIGLSQVAGGQGKMFALTPPTAGMATGALADAGAGQAHENRQPLLVLNFCIALMGMFPPRS